MSRLPQTCQTPMIAILPLTDRSNLSAANLNFISVQILMNVRLVGMDVSKCVLIKLGDSNVRAILVIGFVRIKEVVTVGNACFLPLLCVILSFFVISYLSLNFHTVKSEHHLLNGATFIYNCSMCSVRLIFFKTNNGGTKHFKLACGKSKYIPMHSISFDGLKR